MAYIMCKMGNTQYMEIQEKYTYTKETTWTLLNITLTTSNMCCITDFIYLNITLTTLLQTDAARVFAVWKLRLGIDNLGGSGHGISHHVLALGKGAPVMRDCQLSIVHKGSSCDTPTFRWNSPIFGRSSRIEVASLFFQSPNVSCACLTAGWGAQRNLKRPQMWMDYPLVSCWTIILR